MRSHSYLFYIIFLIPLCITQLFAPTAIVIMMYLKELIMPIMVVLTRLILIIVILIIIN